MKHRIHGLGALGLSLLAVLGLLALTAAAAQAQNLESQATNTAGSFNINGAEALLATLSGRYLEATVLLVHDRNLKITCQEAHVEEGKVSTKAAALATLELLGCLSFSIQSEPGHLADCVIPKGEVTLEAQVLPILHSKEAYLRFVPIEGKTTFGFVLYEKELGCLLPHLNPLSGSLIALADTAESVKPTFKFNSTIQLLVAGKLAFGHFPAYVDGRVELELTGEHAGDKLGIVDAPESTNLVSTSTNAAGVFRINNSIVLPATLTGKQIGAGALTVSGVNVRLECESFDMESGKINTGDDATIKGRFLGCLSFALKSGEHLANCVIPKKEITTEALVLPVRHNKESYLLIVAVEGRIDLASVLYEKKLGCALPHNNLIVGSLIALVDKPEAVKPLIEFSSAVQLLVAGSLTFNGFPSYVEGHAELELTGEHAGEVLEITEPPGPLESTATNTPGVFFVNLGPALLANVTGSQFGLGSLLVPFRDLRIQCNVTHVLFGKFNTETDATFQAQSLGCVSYSLETGELLKKCVIPKQEINFEALVLAISHFGESFVLFEPVEGKTTFTTVLYEKGLECTVPHSNPVNGSLVALVDQLEAVEPLLIFSPEIQLLMAEKLRFGAMPAYVDVHAAAALVGEHTGNKLGVH